MSTAIPTHLSDLPSPLLTRILSHLPELQSPPLRLLHFFCTPHSNLYPSSSTSTSSTSTSTSTSTSQRTNTSSKSSSRARFKHPLPPFPSSLLPLAQTSRTVATALAHALDARAHHVDNYVISSSPALWLIVCAPVIRSLHANDGCFCCRFDQDVMLLPRVLATVQLPRLRCLDLSSGEFYRPCRFGDVAHQGVSALLVKVLCRVGLRLERFTVACNPVFIPVVAASSLPMLMHFTISYAYAGDVRLYAQWAREIFIALASVHPPLLTNMSLLHVEYLPQLDHNLCEDLRGLFASITHLHLKPDDKILRRGLDDTLLHFLRWFTSLSVLTWNGSCTSTQLHHLLSSCTNLHMTFLMPYEKFFVPFLAPIRCNLSTYINELSAVCTTLGHTHVQFAMDMSSSLQILPVLEARLPLNNLQVTLGRNSLTPLLRLCEFNSTTLTKLTIRLLENQHGERVSLPSPMLPSSWMLLSHTITSLPHLSEFRFRAPHQSDAGGCETDLVKFIEHCFKTMGERAILLQFIMPCALQGRFERITHAHMQVLGFVRSYCPNLTELTFRVARYGENVSWGDLVGVEEAKGIMKGLLRLVHQIGVDCENLLSAFGTDHLAQLYIRMLKIDSVRSPVRCADPSWSF